MKHYSLILVVMNLVLLSACVDDKKPSPVIIYESTAGSSNSHSAGTGIGSGAGTQCSQATCHDGNNNFAFVISGTLYDPNLTTIYNNAEIRIYSEPYGSGILFASVDVNALGNFYTTEPLNAPSGTQYFPAVYDKADGRLIHMPFIAAPVNLGQLACNSCHGTGYARLNNGIISNGSKISSYTGHQYSGQNCFTGCHDGTTATVFSTAGTVYEPSGSVIYAAPQPQNFATAIGLYNVTGTPAGELVTLFEVDQSGNFYTTEPLNWGSTLFPALATYDNYFRRLQLVPSILQIDELVGTHSGINTGDCQSCHNTTIQPNITVPDPPP